MKIMRDISMPAHPRPIVCDALDSEEVAALPESLRIRLGADTGERDEWLVIHASWPLSEAAQHLNKLGATWAESTWRPGSGKDLAQILSRLLTPRQIVITE